MDKSLTDNYQSSPFKSHLYQLQKEAPKPHCLLCKEKIENVPNHFGLEYHGTINHHACEDLLKRDGHYLVRWSQAYGGVYTLSLRFCDKIKHYKLYFDGCYYIGEKKFETLDDLVADGLVTLYLELKAATVLHQLPNVRYRQSPYFTLTRSFRKSILRQRTLKNTQNVEQNKLEINQSPATSEHEVESLLNSHTKEEKLESSDSDDVERAHRFQSNTFTGLHWCGFCGNFLWGLVLQGVKCADCGFKAHRQCSVKVPNDCCPDLKDMYCIFGMDLSTSLQMSPLKEHFSNGVPPIVSECIAEVEQRGLSTEGIYRVSGSQDHIDALRLSFERDWYNVSLKERAVPDVHVVAGLLKLYLRLLPLKLITQECFHKLIEANKLCLAESRVFEMADALSLLPPSHYSTLKALIKHLARVCEYTSKNKMTATSLGTIFGPTLIQMDPSKEHLDASELLLLKLSAQEPRIIEALILLHNDVFS